ncbi:MAG: hypothetical protein KGD67_12075, partial [Candidatus Lokiarchaeota archaeon]|nr:hypothetical protein [Candidatus Lokiarchaeota archaeon]
QITIELLGNDVDPKAIMENFFHIKYISNQQLTRSFGNLFSDEGYDFKTMIETFSSNSGRFFDLYRL